MNPQDLLKKAEQAIAEEKILTFFLAATELLPILKTAEKMAECLRMVSEYWDESSLGLSLYAESALAEWESLK